MRKICYKFLVLGLVGCLVAGCKSPQPVIAHDTETYAADTTATTKADSVAVEKQKEEVKLRIVREVRDSTITHIFTKDSASTIIREYHTERTDIDLAFLLQKIDSIATAKADSIASSMRNETDKPVVVKAKSNWEAQKYGMIFGLLISLLIFCVVIAIIRHNA